MPIDASIYFQQQTPDFLGSFEKGMNLKSMLDARAQNQNELAKKKLVEDAYRQGIIKNADGTMGMDQQKTLSALADSGDSKEYLAAQDKFTANNLQQQKLRKEKHDELVSFLGQASSIVKQDSSQYPLVLQEAQKRGYDISMMPQQYGPDAQKLLDFHLGQALSVKDQMEQQNKAKDFGLKEKEYGLKARETAVKEKEVLVKNKKDAASMAAELRKERSNLPTTRATQDVSAAYNKIQSAADNPSPAGDLSLLYGYMKILDPGSTVREGEFATAQNSGSIDQRIANTYNRILNGERLTDEQRKDFITQAGHVYNSQKDVQGRVDVGFKDLATKSGIDPKDVLIDFGANVKKQKPSWAK